MNAIFRRRSRRSAFARGVVDGAASANFVIVPPDLSKLLPKPNPIPSNVRGNMAVSRSISKAMREFDRSG